MPDPSALPDADAAAEHGRGHSVSGHSVSGAPMADRLGVGVSLTCAVHCAATGALSLAPSLAPSFGGDTTGSPGQTLELIELPLLLLALVIGLYSLVPAYRFEHRRPQPVLVFLGGLALLVVSRLVEGPLEIGTTVLGVALIAGAHLFNLRLCSRAHAPRPQGFELTRVSGHAGHGRDAAA